jgi:hypothetical protein
MMDNGQEHNNCIKICNSPDHLSDVMVCVVYYAVFLGVGVISFTFLMYLQYLCDLLYDDVFYYSFHNSSDDYGRTVYCVM